MSQVSYRELSPGVRLRIIHTDKFKNSYFSVNLLSPLQAETAAANALIPQVLRRGSRLHPDMESLSAALDELYGGAIEPVVRKRGETQCVGFVASFLDDAYAPDHTPIMEQAAALLGEILLDPHTCEGVFSPEYTQGEKEQQIRRIRGRINDKRSYATYQLTRLMCREEAYGVDRLGEEPQVAAITPENLWQRYRELCETAVVELYYCGSAQPQAVEEAMRCAFAPLLTGGERVQPSCDIRLHAPREPQVVEEAMDVTQGKLAMGWRTGGSSIWEEDYPALVLFNAVFGGCTLSKLFMNVREKLSLCYFASSSLEKLKGLVVVSSGIEFAQYTRARDEILSQMAAMGRGEIAPEELEGARQVYMGLYRSMLDEPGRLEDYWLEQAVAGLELGPDELAKKLEQVDAAAVAAVAQKMELDTIYFLKGEEGAQA